MPAFAASVPRSTESSQSNMARKRHKATQIRREGVKSPLFPDDVILYVANAEDSRKKKKKPVRNIFRKVGGCRLTHRNQLHLSVLTDRSEKKTTKQLHLLWSPNNEQNT